MRVLYRILIFSAAPSKKVFRKRLNAKPRGGIIDGENASEGQFPYQLSFELDRVNSRFQFCGASLYSDQWAICAGHCVENINPDYPLNYYVSRPK